PGHDSDAGDLPGDARALAQRGIGDGGVGAAGVALSQALLLDHDGVGPQPVDAVAQRHQIGSPLVSMPTWNGTDVTTVLGRSSRASFSASALWPWRMFDALRMPTTNSGITTVMRSLCQRSSSSAR